MPRDGLLQRHLGAFFTVGEEHGFANRHALLQPLDEFGAIGMAGVILELADAGAHGDFLAHDFHHLGAALQDIAKRTGGLEAHQKNRGAGLEQVVLQVVADAARVTHAAGGNDDAKAGELCDGLAVLHRFGAFQQGRIEGAEKDHRRSPIPWRVS